MGEAGLGEVPGREAVELGAVDEHDRVARGLAGEAEHELERHAVHHHLDQRLVALVDRGEVGPPARAERVARVEHHDPVVALDLVEAPGEARDAVAHARPGQVGAADHLVAALAERLGDRLGVDLGAQRVGCAAVVVVADDERHVGRCGDARRQKGEAGDAGKPLPEPRCEPLRE